MVWRTNYVVTEDDYIDYLPTPDHIPAQILDKLRASRRLFLGYTLRDWNARVLLRRIWQDKLPTEDSWAIAHEPDVFEKASWTAVGRAELLAAHSSDYVNALRAVVIETLNGQ